MIGSMCPCYSAQPQIFGTALSLGPNILLTANGTGSDNVEVRLVSPRLSMACFVSRSERIHCCAMREGLHVVLSAAPSLASLSFSFSGSFAITFSNCDHSPSTWLNSLPTYLTISA